MKTLKIDLRLRSKESERHWSLRHARIMNVRLSNFNTMPLSNSTSMRHDNGESDSAKMDLTSISDITDASEETEENSPFRKANEVLTKLKEAIRIMRTLDPSMNGGKVPTAIGNEKEKNLLIRSVTGDLTKRKQFC